MLPWEVNVPAGNHTNLESAPPLSIRCDLLEMISSLASACSATSLYQFVRGLAFAGCELWFGLVRPRQRRDNLRFAFEPDETAFAGNQTYKMFQYLGQQIQPFQSR